MAYATVHEQVRLWGHVMRAFPRAEGDLFPGLTPLVLAAVAVAFGYARTRAAARTTFLGAPPPRRTARLVADLVGKGSLDRELRRSFARAPRGLPPGLGLPKFSFAMELWGGDVACGRARRLFRARRGAPGCLGAAQKIGRTPRDLPDRTDR